MAKVFLSIKTPPASQHNEQSMEAMLRSLHRLLPKNAAISLEFASSNQFLRFYIVTSPEFKNIVESQAFAQFPDAEIEEVSDYVPKSFSDIAISQFYFKHSSLSPFNTYKNLQESFLKSLSSILAKSDPNDKIFFQLALKKIGSSLLDRGFEASIYNVFGKRYIENKATPRYEKFSQDLYTGILRIAYAAENKIDAENKLNTLANLLKGLKGQHNELKKRKFFVPKNIKQLFRERSPENGDFWSSEELATIYHFPFQGSLVSNAVQTTSKKAPAPDILPTNLNTDPKDISLIGETTYRNERKTFGIKRIDRRRHLYIVGKTGSGKSRLLELLLISDIQEGHGCCLIDPHGDLADELLMFVPKNRVKDVVYINPSNKDFPIGFNPLEPVKDYEMRQHLSSFFISIFKKLFAADWNPRMEHLIRYITLALLETPDSCVLGIPRILSDTQYRQRVIKQIQDPVVKSFWTTEFSASNEQFINAASVPIINKVGQFISNPLVRNIVGQQKNMLDFDKFMNEGKIVIINLSKGKIGESNAALLGSMFITKIQQAALARAKIKEEERRDFYFYVDEFQNFATDAFSSILSEARKYRLDLTIAHQYIAQLPDDVKATAFGNVGSILVFAVGGDDAAYLEKEFRPVFTADDMINLNVREMYVRMSIDGKTTPPFSARTINIPHPVFDYSVEIVNHSQMTYGRNKVAVENEIRQWSEASDPVKITNDKDAFPEPIV